MSQTLGLTTGIPAQQRAIRAKCFHPTGTFIAFEPEEIEQSIPHRFEQQVARHPERLAVKSRYQTLTYAALNQMANRVARAIQAQCGVGEEPIALLFEQGAPVIAALLGVLKVGKFYVPLDPSYPPARLTHMLEDSQPRLVVTQTQHLPLAEALARHGPQVLNIDEIGAGLSDENLGLSLAPDTLAYLLYTSGSTGTPKGVLQNHRNVLHMIKNECNGFHLCADDRLSLLYSPSVVSAARNTFDALLNGASVFPFNLREEGLAGLTEWLIQEEITIYKSVATVFRHFAGTLTGEESFPNLRLIFLGSETVYKRDVELYRKHFSPSCLFVVSLSATEITQFREYFVDKEIPIPDSVVPVGYPEEDLQVLLLGEAGHEVGLDAVGQIAVKSRYLSLGYWRRPDLNQARFLPDSSGSGERVYLTGDLGRMRDDGCLIHVGREDFQVKIRGNRVEVGEIETALLDQAGVKEAVVVAYDDPRGDKRLAAYLVASRKAGLTPGELRRSLAAKLPDYMLPAAFVFLDALPLTPSGKVDRRALPAPEGLRPELETDFIAPRTEVEQIIATVWQEVFHIERVGLHDNFFDLGGDSLLLAQVYRKLQEIFSEDISMLDLLKYPTIHALTELLIQKRIPLGEQSEVALEAFPVTIQQGSSGAKNIRHPIGRYIPSRYHPYLKSPYDRIKKSPLFGYFRSKYIQNSRKITERLFSYTPVQLEHKLKVMGITDSDTILMHSGFNFLNGFDGTPEQVIECILNIIGRSGNLVMVSMPYRGSTYQYLKEGMPFDVNNTMSAMGIISETFRRRPGVVRSLNPAHPILAYGPAARWIISDHEKTMYSCGKGSPFEKILQLNAKIFIFNLPPRLMTFFHYLEDRFQETLPVKLYEDAPVESIVIDANSHRKVVKTYVFSHEARKRRDGRNFRRALIRDNMIKTAMIGRTKLAVQNLNQVVEYAQKTVSSGKPLWKV